MKKKSALAKLTLGGVFAALNTVLLLLGGDTLVDLSVLVLCALLTMFLVVETDRRSVLVYAAVTSTLALLFVPSKLYAIEYILFAAAYPLVKLTFERYRALIAFPLKISFLDCGLILCLVLAKFLFAVEDEFFALSVPTILIGTAVFVIYDLALTSCISLYMVKLRKIFRTKR